MATLWKNCTLIVLIPALGGVEIFAGPTTSIKAEGRYHIVPRTFGINPDGFALTVGLKKYF